MEEKYVENRPWGKFEQFTSNEVSTVKIISLNPNSALSFQYHHNRDEFWRVLDGQAKFTIGDQTIEGKIDDEYFIPRETNHRVVTGKFPVRFLEIAYGEFDENDIVRIEDKYNRIKN
jgi:mannose-6-phosphate isomerase-like protein (cupin superfamily)